MDKVLSVHALIEAAASKFNYIVKSPEKEMVLFKAFNEIEGVKNFVSSKTAEFNTKITAQQRSKERAIDASKNHAMENGNEIFEKEDLSGTKERFVDILKELKKSIHTFQNISERNCREMELMLKLSQQ